MPRIVLIIQARISSTRLPGKTMLPLAGEPLIFRMVERLKKCKKIDEIVIATSNNPEDKVLAEVAKKLNVSYFYGSLLDVRDRYLQCAREFKAEFIPSKSTTNT